MKYVMLLLFCITNFCLCTAQSKEELIDAIVKHNVYESDQIGGAGSLSQQYTAFETLAGKLTIKEITQLSNHKNGVLRMYATDYLIEHGEADPVAMFVNELNRKETIETLNGCSGGFEITSLLVYHSYWNKIRIEALTGINYKPNDIVEQAMSKRLKTDVKMREMDSVVISTNAKIHWLVYVRAFENKNFSNNLLPQIEKLGFRKNNPYAIGYLINTYPKLYKERACKYYTEKFPRLKFTDDDENSMSYFHEFLELLLKTGDKKIQQIAVKVVKKSDYAELPWFRNTFAAYNIKI